MVSFRHFGRLGNWLYQLASSYSYALEHGLDFSVPNTTNDPVWNPLYNQHLVNVNYTGQENILLNEVWTADQHFQHYPFKEEWRGLNIVFNSYNQSYKYFDKYRDEIIKAFGYPYEMNKGVCSIHVRRGDYLLYPTKHPVITEEYLIEAIWQMIDNGIGAFKFHSDDINWCKNFIQKVENENIEFQFSENKTPEQDLISMANCEYNICSNSTLALWGAELNQNPDKIVIVPHEDNWFGYGNKNLSVKDLYRSEFIQIPYTPIYEL